jgi:transcriptional regulator with XRE-family HTH domain
VEQNLSRKGGIRIDRAKIDYEIDRRGITQRALAARAGLPESRLSLARHGHAISERSLRKLTQALLETPLLAGSDLLISGPGKKTAEARSLASAEQEASASGRPTPA